MRLIGNRGFSHRMFGQSRLASPTGANLLLHCMASRDGQRGVVQINHGIAEHAARYARFAEALAAAGFHVYSQDHRGHGGTIAPDAPPRSFGDGPSADRVVADIVTVHELIAERHPGLPVILFGHSMGSLLSMRFLQLHSGRVAAAALWNGNFSAGPAGRAAQAILAWERFRLGSDAPSRLLPRLTFRQWARQVKQRRTEFDWLSRDEAEVDRYIADPLCGWDPSVGMWREVFSLIFAGADDRNLKDIRRDLPINLVGGAHDPATFGGRAVLDLEKRLGRMGFSNLASRVYPQTRHESLNELNRNMIIVQFIEWAVEVTNGKR
jgi:alpha-beta hydrolase superfamily lysophospholipase